MSFKKIDPKTLENNPFKLLADDWMLLTAGDKSAHNTMTVSWGGVGVLWGMNVATCYVRPQRYTFDFMEKGEYFTLSAYPADKREALVLCGSKSGRDVDKDAACGFTPAFAEGDAPYYEEAALVLVCKKLYQQDFAPENFLDARIDACYPSKDYHRMYIGEIVEVLVKE